MKTNVSRARLIFTLYYSVNDPDDKDQLFTEVEVASGGYLPSREATR